MHGRMVMAFVMALVVTLGLTVVAATAQESRPAPGAGGMMGPGMMGQPGMMGGGMMMCPMMGMMPAMGGMPGMGGMSGMAAMPGGDPKAAARALRLRADMLKAMSEVLQRHAAELEKGP